MGPEVSTEIDFEGLGISIEYDHKAALISQIVLSPGNKSKGNFLFHGD
jgi:hypothetical protein